jgi:NAD(P)H-hydrate repair Nnr-like enzyme with NAD(P)H-hydrate dehydratase domain
LISKQSVPTILDAGALHLAGNLDQPTVITPHAGELSRLLRMRGVTVDSEAIEGDPKKWARRASGEFNVTVLLKGSKTVVAHGKDLIELPASTPWLATAGTGDVLAGILGALVATNYIEILNDPDHLANLAASAAFIHNAAALLASRGSPITATQVIDYIPEAIGKIL